MGDGSNIRFWHDVGLDFEATFPKFIISHFKEVLVADNMHISNDCIRLNTNFIKLVHDWEVESINLFFDLLYSFRLRRGSEDKIY